MTNRSRTSDRSRLLVCLAACMSMVACVACASAPSSSPSDSPDASKPLNDGGSPTADGSDATGGNDAGTSGTFVERGDTPLDDSPSTLDALEHPRKPGDLWGDVEGPYPTNAWFMNLVLGSGTQRVNVLPYLVKALDQRFGVSDPDLVVSDSAITTPDLVELAFGAVQTFRRHVVEAHDLLSVTLRYDSDAGSMRLPLVRGMPYVTAVFKDLSPVIATGGAAITTVNGQAGTSFSGKRFEVALNSGRTWIVYASAPLTLTRQADTLVASAPFTGTVRIARVFDEQAKAVLDAHAGAVPTGGRIELSVTRDTGKLLLQFAREGAGELLMMALPHQLPRIGTATQTKLARRTLRGVMRGVLGDELALSYALNSITWSAPRAIPEPHKPALRAALVQDRDYVPVATDPYFGGKHLAKLARLALIADEVGEAETRDTLLARLAPLERAWLTGTNGRPLAYDRTWGGIVSKAGVADQNADFGQGYYNDHHFHYGYHLYAAAVLSRYDASWARDNRASVLAFIRDIANPSAADPHFTPFRAMDFYEGHSWAAGLFEFGDGRNQESTSEAVNAWYALELYGLAVNDARLTNLGRMLRAIEVDGAQVYWQVESPDDLYPEPFAGRRAVGILWSTKLDFGTFFGNEPAKIYGIQMIPFTPVSEELLASTWVAATKGQFLAAAASISEPGWQSFMVMAEAIVDPDAARPKLEAFSTFDDGNSRTNTLYWAATR